MQDVLIEELPMMLNGIIIVSGGKPFHVDLENISDFELIYNNCAFKTTSSGRESNIMNAVRSGDIISTGLSHLDEVTTTSTSREFNGRKSGRVSAINTHLLNAALSDYEKALALKKGVGRKALPKWAEQFNVQVSTVANWLSEWRKYQKGMYSSKFGQMEI